MAAGNQTRLSFAHQKPGSRRILDSKRAKAVSTTDTDASAQTLVDSDVPVPSPQEQPLEKADTQAQAQTMEEKLAAYKKEKEAKAAQKAAAKVPQVVEKRSVRTRTMTREVEKNGATQRKLRTTTKTTAITKTQSTIEFSRISKGDKAVIMTAVADDDQQSTSSIHEGFPQAKKEETEHVAGPAAAMDSNNRDPSLKRDEVTADDLELKEQSTRSAGVQSNTGKPVAEDTVFEERPRRSEDDLDDNIHPLARTVVQVALRTYPKKVHDEESSTSHHKTEAQPSTTTLSRKTRKPTILEPTTDTPLPLPSHLGVLFANFKALESILVFTKRQGQLSFYHKLKKHVELQSSRNFEMKHLAQFKTLLPEGYKFTAAPCLFEGVKTRSILIEMLELEDESEVFIPQADKRRKLFMERLFDHIKKHHQEFLTSTAPPRTDTYPHQWHPDFDLENVPHIEEAELPLLKPTVIDASNLDLRILGNKRELSDRPPVESSSSTATSNADEGKPLTATQVDKVTPESPASKTLSSLEQLKERIRQKQLERKESGRGMATPEEKRQALTASRLPSVFDLIRFKRVDVILLKTLAEQVVKSSRMPISDVEGTECLEMLAKTLPEWCNVFSLNDGNRYFKVLKDDGHGGKIEHDEKALRARLVAKSVGKLA